MARPAHKRTDETARMVEALAAAGFGQEEIGAVLGISHVTLRKHYRHELDTAASKANAKIASRLFQTAMGTNGAPWPQSTAAMIFWAKTRMGWKETSAHEHSGPNGGPIETAEASPLERIESRLARLAAASGAGEDPALDDEGGD